MVKKKQMKEIKGTELTLNMDTSANTAMFKLSTYITLKTSRRNSNKQRVYLLIPPERINTITTKISPHRRSTAADVPDDYALHFSLTQKPDFIGPRIHHIESKRGTQEQLALIQRLATITEFTIHLTSSDAIARRRKDFELITTIFSLENPKNRPYKDKKHGDLATLYAGKGGKVINMDEGLAHAEASLPPYPGRFLRSPIRSPPSRSKNADLLLMNSNDLISTMPFSSYMLQPVTIILALIILMINMWTKNADVLLMNADDPIPMLMMTLTGCLYSIAFKPALVAFILVLMISKINPELVMRTFILGLMISKINIKLALIQ